MSGRESGLLFSFTAPRRRGLVFALLAALVATLGGVVTTAAPATRPSHPTSPAPVTVVIDRVTSDLVLPTGLPADAVPYVLVKAGDTVHVDVSFYDASGAPASFTKDTTLTITSNVGTLSTVTGTALKGSPTATVDTSLTTAVNQVELTVGAGSGPKAPTPGMSYVPGVKDLRFDVLTDIKPNVPSTSGVAFEAGIGGGGGDCGDPTPSAPVCETVILPRGAGSNVLLSIGACDTDVRSLYAPCFKGNKGASGGAIVQALFAPPAGGYSVDDPAIVIVKCDKSLCGGGSIRGRTVMYSLRGNSPLVAADPCPSKSTMATAGVPCVDYVQSKRDGAGDTHLYLLTDQDIRTGIG